MNNKYGFWVVIVHHKDGSKNLVHDYDGCADNAQYNSEDAAKAMVAECQCLDRQGSNYYYWKYIPWGEFT